jgi:hypothetical protein
LSRFPSNTIYTPTANEKKEKTLFLSDYAFGPFVSFELDRRRGAAS